MNYRHHFHAGNFADAMKHTLLVQLIRALQKKEKGFLCLDTHAGRGQYDLPAAAIGDSLARQPEWPGGIGRLAAASDTPPGVAEYLALVRQFDRLRGNFEPAVRFYPGSPVLAQLTMRAQDRLALCEKHPDECAALRSNFASLPRVSVHEMDGFAALRAMLPPPERRALILIDPPFEAQDEFAQIAEALGEGLRRFPSGVYAVWYPLTERARVDAFFSGIRGLNLPPTLIGELAVAGERADLKMKGCGLLVINPPWQFDAIAQPMLDFLAKALAQAEGGCARVEWLVGER